MNTNNEKKSVWQRPYKFVNEENCKVQKMTGMKNDNEVFAIYLNNEKPISGLLRKWSNVNYGTEYT